MTAVVRDHDVVAGAIMRVRAGDEVVGGAFLVAPGLVATTATVVAECLGDDPGAEEPPTGTVQLDFPLLRPEHDLPAVVPARVQRWSPARTGENGSALLQLLRAAPPGARMPPLRRVEPLAGRSFSVLGFPAGLADGVWSTGRLRATDEDHERLRLDSAAGEYRVDAGFCGAPVWEADTGAVVGMAGYRYGPDAAELIPIHEVLGLDPEQLPCPYRGLRTFDETDAGTFFGRDDDIERLVDLVAQRHVVAVAGPSGAGKSSLIRAGLVPRLRATGAEIGYVRAEPGALDRLPEGHGHQFVIVIDQFEDLAALDPAAARTLLEAVVRRTQAQREVRAVLTLRWTTLDEMLTPELIGTLDAGTVLVGPLDRDRLHDAIVRPAEHPPGLAFEPGLVETILDDAGAEPGRLPLVESLLADLWERRDGGFLTQREYEAAGGVAGALAQHAESVVGSLPAGSKGPGSNDAARRLLTALARPDRDGRFVRRAVRLDELPTPQRELVPALTAGRLLTVGRSGHGDVVELAHQALIDHWPRLQDWLSADRAFLAWREQVGIQRERWVAEDRADTVLLRGAPLAGASDWLPEREGDLPRADLDYLRRSAARQHREVRRWRIIAATVAFLTLAAAALAVVSVRSGDQIATRLATANADALGREAQARAAEDPATAAQLALTAWRADPRNPQARSALLQSYLAMRSVERELPDVTRTPITDVLVGGDTAVVRADPHPVVVTGLSGPTPRHAELSDVRFDRWLMLSRDGRWLAFHSEDRTTFQLRDLTGARPPVTLPHTDGTEVGGARFSPDAERLAWVEIHDANRHVLRIWDLGTGTEISHGVPSLFPDVSGVHLTPDPDQIIVRRGDPQSEGSRLVLLSLTDGAELATYPAGFLVVLGGAAVATCEEPADVPGSPATVLVTPLDGSAPRRIGAGTSCTSAISSSGNALVEASGHALEITDLWTGAAFHAATPADLPAVHLWGFDAVPTFDVLPDRPTAVLARGTSLMFLRGEPASADRATGEWNIGFDDDIRVVRNRDSLRTEERSTGRTLGELTGVRSPSEPVSIMGGSLWVGRVAGTGFDVTRHEPRTLQRTSVIRLPGRDDGTPPADHDPELAMRLEPEADGGRLFAIADSVLSVWDPDSGQPLGPPIHLGATPADVDFYRSDPHLQLRPGHPGQVAVLGDDDVQIWDVPAGRLVTTIPAAALHAALGWGALPIAFDATGNRLAVVGRDRTVQLWDIPSARPVRPPIPAPTITGFVGFGADGHLVATQEDDETTLAAIRLAFIDVDTGAKTGSVNIKDATGFKRIVGLSDDRRTLHLDDLDEEQTFDMPVTAPGWRDGLCTAVGRELTAAEKSLLPPGSNADPPCS